MASINWTQEAEAWLEIIFNHIAESNKDAAARLITKLYKKAETLKDFPQSGIQNSLKRLDSRPTDRGNDGSIVEFIHRH